MGKTRRLVSKGGYTLYQCGNVYIERGVKSGQGNSLSSFGYKAWGLWFIFQLSFRDSFLTSEERFADPAKRLLVYIAMRHRQNKKSVFRAPVKYKIGFDLQVWRWGAKISKP